MSIDVHFHSATVAELHLEMHALLIGHTSHPDPVAAVELYEQRGVEAAAEAARTTPKTVAAQKKAAEKAAKEAAEAATKAAQQAISTGEERIDPEADKQDAADEAAETPKAVDLTHDDVKKVLGVHVQAFGMTASQADVKHLLNDADKVSAIPDTQKALAAAILTIAAAIEKNPRGHEMVGELDAAAIAKVAPLVQAARAVK